MNRLIDTLLKTLRATYADVPPELDLAACAVQDALESGALDCLIDRPGDECPPSGINVLALWPQGWKTSYYMAEKDYIAHGWYAPGWTWSRVPIKWRELPPVPEVKK